MREIRKIALVHIVADIDRGLMRVPKRQREAHKSYFLLQLNMPRTLYGSALLQNWKVVVMGAMASM